MKRLRDWLFPSTKPKFIHPNDNESDQLPNDVWCYIINLYYHLKFDEQWRLFEDKCLSCNIFLGPSDEISVPIYAFDPNIYVSVCPKIHRFYWGSRGLYGVEVTRSIWMIGLPDKGVRKMTNNILLDQPMITGEEYAQNIRGQLISPIGYVHRDRNEPIGTFIIKLDSDSLPI